MYDSALLMQIADALSDLDDNVPRKGLAEVRELHNLVEELAALHH